jgi:hypothetical protein
MMPRGAKYLIGEYLNDPNSLFTYAVKILSTQCSCLPFYLIGDILQFPGNILSWRRGGGSRGILDLYIVVPTRAAGLKPLIQKR